MRVQVTSYQRQGLLVILVQEQERMRKLMGSTPSPALHEAAKERLELVKQLEAIFREA
jgi:hypothetical protein